MFFHCLLKLTHLYSFYSHDDKSVVQRSLSYHHVGMHQRQTDRKPRPRHLLRKSCKPMYLKVQKEVHDVRIGQLAALCRY